MNNNNIAKESLTPPIGGQRSCQSMMLLPLILIVLCLGNSSCYHKRSPIHIPIIGDSIKIAQDSISRVRLQDSITFAQTHHYSENFNFVVREDSLALLLQQPEEKINNMQTDSFTVVKGTRMVVADIKIISKDTCDSVWVQLATENAEFGWIHESTLLDKVDPDDPISQFISAFSDSHTILFLLITVLIIVAYIIKIMRKNNAKIVHFNDIDSLYPTILVLNVAVSATFYASIQLFSPESWRAFYFSPSLNPFSQPLIIGIFLTSVWTMVIMAVAVVDDVRHHLKVDDAILYLCGLAAVGAVNYIVFSISTLYLIGYPLLIAYIYYSLRTYIRKYRVTYNCGKCGNSMKRKGKCPVCGTINE